MRGGGEEGQGKNGREVYMESREMGRERNGQIEDNDGLIK
jgi:hypothetical protein